MKETIPNWVYSISKKYLPAQEIPLFGNFPKLSLENLVERLIEEWSLSDIHFDITSVGFKSKEDIHQELGNRIEYKTLDLAPLKGEMILLYPKADIARFLSALLSYKGSVGETSVATGLFEAHLLDFLRLFNVSTSPSPLSTRISEVESSLQEGLCLDIRFRMNSESFLWRLVLSEQLQKSVQAHFPVSIFPEALHVEVPLVCRIGRTTIKQEEWNNLRVGDFLSLDYFSYDLEAKKGSTELCIEGIPVLKGRLKNGTLKIKEDRAYYEEGLVMENNEDMYHFDKDFSSHDDDLAPLDRIEEEEALREELREEEEEVPSTAMEKRSLNSVKDVPLTVHVEMGQIQMSLGKLSSLKPGNELDLGILPEHGVYLSVNNKPIAKGELIKLGDTIGVRIIELG